MLEGNRPFFTLASGTKYRIAVEYVALSSDASNYIASAADTAPTHPGNQGMMTSNVWAAVGANDMVFQVYTDLPRSRFLRGRTDYWESPGTPTGRRWLARRSRVRGGGRLGLVPGLSSGAPRPSGSTPRYASTGTYGSTATGTGRRRLGVTAGQLVHWL
jgi:hypothetical protein